MARYTGPDCKLCRRERMKLYLKGIKCETPKCPIERRPYPPGEHGRARIKESEYLFQLREKQKARRIYGIMEKQFRNYYESAAKQKGITGENLLRLLETRLDNVVFRAGFSTSRDQARQLVRHRHFQVNGKTVSIPSFRVRPGDAVAVREKSRRLIPVQEAVQLSDGRIIPTWLDVNKGELSVTVSDLPARAMIDTPVQEQLIVELYSK
jgi:small subunit ribosomal protein S4